MNSGGWRYLPPVLQTKHNFYFHSDSWLLQQGAWGRAGGQCWAGAVLHPCILPRDPALLLLIPAIPGSIEIQRRMPSFVRHHGVSEETLQPRLITVICTHWGWVHLPASCSQKFSFSFCLSLFLFFLSSFLSFCFVLFSSPPIYFCFNLHIIISAKTSEITSDK